jgi:transcriptional regulator with XRE-family HTH domain
MNAVLKFRKALGLNQVRFADLVGKSYASIRNYEKGIPLPPDVAEKMAALAVQHGLADVAIELRGGAYEVKRVVEPAETLIPRGRREEPAASSRTNPGKPSLLGKSERDKYHGLLNEVFDSGDPDAIPAVTRNLEVFAKYVRLHPGPSAKKRRA